MIFLVFKLYALVNYPMSSYGGIFESVEAAAATAAIMILLGAFARVGCDEMWDTKNVWLFIAGIVAYLASVTCLVLLLTDMGMAAHGIADGYMLRSFFTSGLATPWSRSWPSSGG